LREILRRISLRRCIAVSTAWISALTPSSAAWSVEYQTGMSKSLSDAERLDTATAATLAAQQLSIDDLYRQVAEIKRKLPPRH
jgi:hypothetical protein